MEKRISDLLKSLKIKYNKLNLYEQALTHPSYNGDNNAKHIDYEKLEFMGDAVLSFISADLVYKYRPEMSEGDLTKLRSALVSTKPLASYARKLSLDQYIRVGRSISFNQVKKSDKILENVFEALLAAIYLDAGLKVAYNYVKNILLEEIINFDTDHLTDYKSKLQEEIQTEHRESVTYVTVSTKGPAHDRTFTVNVLFNGIVLGTGSGKSKKKAEENAAKDALSKRRTV